MLEKTTSLKLYRAGSPDEGQGFWTPSESYARRAHPDGALHEAALLPGFALKTFLFCQSEALLAKEYDKREADVLVFRSPDGRDEEYCVLNPNCIKIIQ